MPTLAPKSDSTLIRRHVQLQLAQGLHIRACSRIVAIVGPFSGKVQIRCGERCADATSMFELIQLIAIPGADLVLEGDGEGADQILDRLEKFLSQVEETHE